MSHLVGACLQRQRHGEPERLGDEAPPSCPKACAAQAQAICRYLAGFWLARGPPWRPAANGSLQAYLHAPTVSPACAALILSGCTREEARARLQDDIQADTIDIIHARFPCRSPELHFFGYRFRVILKGEFGDGDICWNMATRQWSWRILRGQSLSRLNPRN